MDEAKKAFESLISFPPELWASVTCYLYLDHLSRLKLTGNKQLWSRLCAERAVRVINARKQEIVFQGWPAFVREFPRIEEVYIGGHFGDTLTWWDKLNPKLNQMPKTLQKLFLLGSESSNSEFFVSDDLEVLSLVKYVPQLEYLEAELTWSSSDMWMGPYTVDERNNANFALLPPNLASLICTGWDVSHPLPSSLTRFEVAEEVENSKVDSSSSPWSFNFPSSITDLAINDSGAMDTEAFLRELPSSLTKFSTASRISKSIELLPQSVTDLDVIFGPSILRCSPKELISWPCSLQRLHVDHLPYRCWSFLPNTITNLQVYYCGASETNFIDDHPIFNLPKSITRLSIYFEEDTFIDCHRESATSEVDTATKSKNLIGLYASMVPRSKSSEPSNGKPYRFPTNLTKLSLTRGQLSPRAASELPPTLTWLHVDNIDSNVCKQLPHGITELTTNAAAITPELIKFIPRSVIHLSMPSAELDSPWLNYYDNGRKTTVSEMMELYGDGFTFSPSSELLWQGDCVLPIGLSFFEIDALKEVGDAFFQKQKFASLTSLDLPKAMHITDLSIPLLSRHLTLLDLSHSSAVSGASFEFLPRELWYLSLHSSTQICDSHIPFLPPRLEYLRLYSATLLTDRSIPLFPRTLEELDIGSNSLISMDSFSLLPPKILDPEAHHIFNAGTWSVWRGKATAK